VVQPQKDKKTKRQKDKKNRLAAILIMELIVNQRVENLTFSGVVHPACFFSQIGDVCDKKYKIKIYPFSLY
jgi:hypothetical protein